MRSMRCMRGGFIFRNLVHSLGTCQLHVTGANPGLKNLVFRACEFET
jgi:hypothetical protein